MQVAETKNDGLKRAYKVIVPASDIEARLISRLGEIARTARMPGFRVGKVPVSLLRKTYGNSVLGEILEQTVKESSQSAINEKELRPVSQPKIEINNFEDGKDLEYSIELEIFPEVVLADFSTIKLERLKVPAIEEEVEATIDKIAESRKETRPVKERNNIEKGDIVVIDFLGSIGGDEFDGGKAENYSLEVGSGSFVPGFEEQLIGHNLGEKFEIKVTFPKDYTEELASKEAIFDVTVKEIQESIPVEINDELAKQMGVDSLEELRKNIREGHEKELDGFSRTRMRRELLDILDTLHEFDLPEGMSNDEFDTIWQQFEHQRKNHPEQLDEDDKHRSDDELKEEYRRIASRRVRLALLLAEVGRVNNISVSEEELNRGMIQEAQRHQGQEKEFLDKYKDDPQALQAIRSTILEDKVVDFILELADITEREATIQELIGNDEGTSVSADDANQVNSKKKRVTKKKRKSSVKGRKTKK